MIVQASKHRHFDPPSPISLSSIVCLSTTAKSKLVRWRQSYFSSICSPPPNPPAPPTSTSPLLFYFYFFTFSFRSQPPRLPASSQTDSHSILNQSPTKVSLHTNRQDEVRIHDRRRRIRLHCCRSARESAILWCKFPYDPSSYGCSSRSIEALIARSAVQFSPVLRLLPFALRNCLHNQNNTDSFQQTCITNMLGLAPSLGCGATDAACLCSNVNFAYGIRDCSNAACGSDVAPSVIAYGVAYCSCE